MQLALVRGAVAFAARRPPSPARLPQSFRPGQRVKARVLGFRPMDGLAVLSLKRSVVESSILSIAGAPLAD